MQSAAARIPFFLETSAIFLKSLLAEVLDGAMLKSIFFVVFQMCLGVRQLRPYTTKSFHE